MPKTRPTVLSRALVGAFLLCLLPAVAGAVQHEVRIYLDLDDDTATGCEVTAVDGVFSGAEQVLITTVETSSPPDAGTITDAALAECTDEVTDTFGVPTSFDGNWPVGVGNGVGGRDVVETYAPLLALVIQDPSVVRVGVVVTDEQGGEEALLTVDGTPDGPAILLNLQSVLEIPTLGEWGLILLALLLAAASIHLMGRRGTAAVGVALLVLATGVAWAAGTLDGLTDDWSASDQLAANGLVLFGKGAPDQLCFRVDLDLLFNQPPVAEPDAFATDEDTPVGGDVLADNGSGPDSDPEGDPLTVTEVNGSAAAVGVEITLPSGALLTLNADGTFTYDPNGAFESLGDGDSDADGFTYTISDPSGGTDTAAVTVTIDGVNDCPTAVDDAFATDEDAPVGGDVLADNGGGPDSDPEGDPLTVTEVNGSAANVGVEITLPSGALLTVNADGTFSYDPNGAFGSLGDGESDTDSFTYTISDGDPACSSTATVTLTINGLNDPPVAQDDAFTTDEKTPVAGDVLADNGSGADSDPNGDALTVTEVDGSGAAVGVEITLASGALLTVNPDGTFSYDPNGAFDSLGDGDSDTDGFAYTVSDPFGATDTATVTITIDGVNDCPTAANDAVTTDEDTALAGDVLTDNGSGADSDPEGDALTVTEVNGSAANVGVQIPLASGALLTVNADGTFTYDPNDAFESLGDGDSDTDSFTYTIFDGDPACAETATVTVTIDGVNDAPTVTGEVFDVAAGNFEPAIGNTTLRFAGSSSLTHPHVFVNGTVLDNELDPENDPFFITQVDGDGAAVGSPKTLPSGAVVTLEADGEFTYEPPLGFEGTGGSADSFTYTVSDGTDSAVGTVTLEVAEMVWYLDEDASGGGNDGRSGSPFESVADFNAVQGGGLDSEPEAGDLIFLHDSADTYSGGIELLDQQKLYGEGVELLVAGQSLVSAGTRPGLENAAGDTVTVLADVTNGDRTGVEIRGLALSSTSGNAIDVASADSQVVEVTIADNLIDGSSAEGIDLNPGSSGAFTATIENNTFSTSSPTGDAIDVVTASGSGDVEVAINDNTDITSAANGIHLDGTLGTGTLFVTGFANNTVHGNTGGASVMVTDVTFDADPSDTDFDEVAGGTWSIGSNGNAVGAAGMYLGTTTQEVEGHLSFDQLDVYAGNGAGLDVTGAGLFGGGTPGAGFQLGIAAGTIEATGGPGVTIDPATLGISLDSVTATNSPSTGISLTDVAGAFSATGGSIATAGVGSGPTFQVSGGSVAASYGGSVASADGQSVQVQNMTGGTVTLNGPVDDDGAGVSITGNDAGTSVTFNGALALDTTTNTAFTATGDGSVTVASAPTNTISTTTGMGLLINGVDAAGSFDFDSVSVSNGGAAGISIQSSAGTKTFGLVNVTNSGGAGLFASNAGTVSVTNGASSIATTGQPAVDADNTALGATFASLTSTGSTTTGIDLASVGGSFTATSVTIDGTTGAGVQLTGNSATVALNGGTIGATTTTGGNAVDVDGGAANVTIAAAITNSAARSVEVTNRSGGAVTVSGSISDTGTGVNVASNSAGSTTFSNASKVINTGASPAVTLATNGGHTVNFTNGGLDIDTTSGAGFSATVSGTVNVTGGANTVNTTTGTGVNIANVTIGASDVTFESVSADGASAGIVLDTTGTTGDFEVTGDGASSTADTTAGRTTAAQGGGSLVLGSGGTITNTTDGVRLTSATDVVLRNMVIGEGTAAPGDAVSGTTVITDNGIEATSVTNLVLDNVLISQTGDHGIEGFGSNVGLTLIHTEILNAGDDGAGPTDGDDAMDFNTGSGAPLTGAVSIQSSILAGMSDTGLEVENFSGDLDLTVTDSFIGNNDHSDASCNPCEGDGFLLRADGGSATIDMVVRDTTFNDIANDGIDLGNDQANNVSTLIAENLAGTNNDGADNLIDTANTNGTLRVRITDLSSDSFHRGTVLFFKADGAATTDVTINTSGASPNLIQGSALGNGIEVFIDGDDGSGGGLQDGTGRLLVSNTDLSSVAAASIFLNVQDMLTAAGSLDATIDDVTFTQPTNNSLAVGSLETNSGNGGNATLQIHLTDSTLAPGSNFLGGGAIQGLAFLGDRITDLACAASATCVHNTTTGSEADVATFLGENGNTIDDGGVRALNLSDIIISSALRNGAGTVGIVAPSAVTAPTLP